MRRPILGCLAVCLTLWAHAGHAQINNNATIANVDDFGPLKRMRDHFAQSTEIEFRTSFRETSDIPGLGRRGSAKFYIRRPNSFRVELSTSGTDYVFISDGKTFTVMRPKSREYARMPASQSIPGTMYLGVGLLGAQAKLIDFLLAVDHGEQVTVETLGGETIEGRSCDRLSVRRFDDRWDVWIERDGPPVPRKLVSRALASNDRSVQTNEFEWTTVPSFTSDLFSFAPQKDAREVSPSDIE